MTNQSRMDETQCFIPKYLSLALWEAPCLSSGPAGPDCPETLSGSVHDLLVMLLSVFQMLRLYVTISRNGNEVTTMGWRSTDRLDERDYEMSGSGTWNCGTRSKLGKKPQGWWLWRSSRGVQVPLLQKLGMESTILPLSQKHVKTDVKSSPDPSVTVLFQEGQLNTPVHHSGSSGADWKVDLKVSV